MKFNESPVEPELEVVREDYVAWEYPRVSSLHHFHYTPQKKDSANTPTTPWDEALWFYQSV